MRSVTFEIEPLLEEIKVYLPKLIQVCNSVSELLYAPITQQTWAEFGELFQGVDDLYKAVNSIGQELENSEEDALLYTMCAKFAEQLAHQFAELNRWMDEEEFVQAGDCIKYELTGLFHAFAIKLGEEKEVVDRRFLANLVFLEQHYPQAYQLLKSLSPDNSRYQITYASNGSPNIYMCTNDNNMIYLYSNYEPEYEARRWVESLEETLAGKTNVVVYGIGLGYHLLQLARKYPKHRLIIYEPDEQVMLAAMKVVDFKKLFSELNIELVVGWDKAIRHKTFFRFVKYAKGDTAVTSLPPYDKVNMQRKLEFFEDAMTAIKHFEMSARTAAYYGIQLYQNRLYNLAHLVNTPSIKGLRDKLKGQTAVIVGAGPSLEKDIEHLRLLKDHALIIAAGTAVQSLKHFGITPHLVVSLDFGESNDVAFRHLDLDDVPFLYSPQIKYTILDGKRRLIHLLLENDLTSSYLLGLEEGEPLFTSSTPTVTGPAIQAAIYMGCNEIVFTGQDFSYPTEQMYATGAKHVTEEESKAFVDSARLQVENVQGGMNRSNDMMQVTLGEIEKLLNRYPHIKFTNTSQLGAKIKHTVWHSMESVLQRLVDVNVPSDLLKKEMEANLRPFGEARKAAIANRIFEMPEQIIHIETTLKRIEQKLGGLQALSRMKQQKCHKTMVDIEEMWETVVHNKLFEFSLAFIITNDIRTYERDLSELVEEKNVVRKADLFCKVVGSLVEAILECLPMVNTIVKEAIRRVELQHQLTIAE